jgi:hypothetical protein
MTVDRENLGSAEFALFRTLRFVRLEKLGKAAEFLRSETLRLRSSRQ